MLTLMLLVGLLYYADIRINNCFVLHNVCFLCHTIIWLLGAIYNCPVLQSTSTILSDVGVNAFGQVLY